MIFGSGKGGGDSIKSAGTVRSSSHSSRRPRGRNRLGRDERAWAVAATAHPAKFEGIVEPLIGTTIEPPPALAALLARPSRAEPLANRYEDFIAALRG